MYISDSREDPRISRPDNPKSSFRDETTRPGVIRCPVTEHGSLSCLRFRPPSCRTKELLIEDQIMHLSGFHFSLNSFWTSTSTTATSTTTRILFIIALIQYLVHGDALQRLSPVIFYNPVSTARTRGPTLASLQVPTTPIEPLVASNRGPRQF